MEQQEEHWARETLREIAMEGIKERRRARRWGIFFKLLILAYLIAVFALAVPSLWRSTDVVEVGRHVAVVDLNGAIASDSKANADRIIKGLEAAFGANDVAGVMLRINSPGGSPVESRRINAAIKRLRDAHPDVTLYAVAGDIMASGAYYVAAAADEVYADPASLVGSIGVVMGGFGFTDAMDKVGVERRLYTAGRNKAMLDPFSAPDPDVEAHVQTMLDDIHTQFIQAVREGRGDRLADDERLFSGLIWTGERGKALGLVDGLATPREVAREIIGVERTVNYTPRGNILDRITERLGMVASQVRNELLTPRLW
ncbi:S49 family peptidase [Arhodomonas sp. AD133]|uniref:S49 family peptidase n=1 Tax=Arhodomonas sp. AD133 TaxID=3415009 RepID=UPI003EBB6DAC